MGTSVAEPPVAKEKLQGLFCVQCRHVECEVKDQERMLCVFCDDGEMCPTARREIANAARMKSANVVNEQVVWAKAKKPSTTNERANAAGISGASHPATRAIAGADTPPAKKPAGTPRSTPAARSNTNGREPAAEVRMPIQKQPCATPGCPNECRVGNKYPYCTPCQQAGKHKTTAPAETLERLTRANKRKLKEVPPRMKRAARANGNGHAKANGHSNGNGRKEVPPPSNGFATVRMSEAHLDRFLTALSLEEKAQLVTDYLERDVEGFGATCRRVHHALGAFKFWNARERRAEQGLPWGEELPGRA